MMMESKVVAAVVCLLGSWVVVYGRSEGRNDEEGGGDVAVWLLYLLGCVCEEWREMMMEGKVMAAVVCLLGCCCVFGLLFVGEVMLREEMMMREKREAPFIS